MTSGHFGDPANIRTREMWGEGVYSQPQLHSRFLALSKLLLDWSVSSVDEQSQAVQRGNKVVEGLSEAWLISQPAIYFESNLM